MNWLKSDLAQLSDGRGGRAALILVVAHLIPSVIALGLWMFGLLSVFDNLRWIPTILVVGFALASLLFLFLRFGFWGTARTFGQGGGENYQNTFSPGVGFALGWLRWFLQIVAAFTLFIPVLLTVGNARWWQITSTPELEQLGAKAATMPIPETWKLKSTETDEVEFVVIRDRAGDNTEPNGFVSKTFTVPTDYSVNDLKAWLKGPGWANNPDGESFGALERPRCDAEFGWCRTQLVPGPGQHPEYFIRADLNEPAYEGDDAEVVVRLDYRKFAPPDYEVSDATVARANQIPVPDNWVPYDVVEETTNSGETFTRFFNVPDDFTHEDLEAWMTGPTWIDPPSGKPFGKIDVDLPCREISLPSQESPKWMCTAIVPDRSSGPIESIRASVGENHTVQLNISRNG